MAPLPAPLVTGDTAPVVGVRVTVEGVVQGVGFRPFVWREATALGLDGSVRNDDGRVELEVVGPAEAVDALITRLTTDPPPRARVDQVRVLPLDDARRTGGFAIDESTANRSPSEPQPGRRLFPPDLGTCDACLAEVLDPTDRRYRYPFTNCTDCGPRATIIDGLPYDRSVTVMRAFPLCPACAAEYRDPADRRFHAEPVACPDCGPRLAYRAAVQRDTALHDDAALRAAVADLRAGLIVAVKGLGGYHLVCDATDEAAVTRLRERKRRWAKPFAVLVTDLAAAADLAEIDDHERALLTGPARPVVLLAQSRPAPHTATSRVAPAVTAGAQEIGLLLPSTPLHHLLAIDVGRPLVLTSGNLTDEPVVTDDDDAAHRLASVADAFLDHDRPIRARYDDSVLRSLRGRPQMLRRARGHAPDALNLPLAVPGPTTVLAVGAELKHTFTLAAAGHAHVAPHNGDLEDLLTHQAFVDGLAHLRRLLDLDPDVVAHDLHPGYLSTQYAVRHFPADRRVGVQHHHAHIASCAAEHGLTTPVLGVAYDGLGLGDDGTLWGGEVLVADLLSYRRFGRFGRAPLPGGALAVRRPYRTALGYLLGAEDLGGPRLAPDDVASFAGRYNTREVDVIRTQLERHVNAPLASSAGRLFDAVAAILGLRDVVEYEGQAAVELERAAADHVAPALPYRLIRVDGLLVYDPSPTLAAVLAAAPTAILDSSVPRVAAAFHETVVEVTREMLHEARRETGLEVTCLSGGVLQNRRLATTLLDRLTGDGFTVHLNEQVPCNDGGLSYGQAAVAAATLAGTANPVPRSATVTSRTSHATNPAATTPVTGPAPTHGTKG
jgi:hydrogenase maturation protein HypF